jgi:hypothetical protein
MQAKKRGGYCATIRQIRKAFVWIVAAVYTAYNRYKVNRWYRNVRRMDFHVPQMDKAEIETSLAELDNIDKQMQERVRVSPFYMRDFYDLRGHIDLMQSRLRKRLTQLEEQTTEAPAET